jgi:DNA-binding beta-propeller fold protein YncE
LIENVPTTGPADVPDAHALAYRAVENWPSIPPEIELGDVAGIAIDEKDQVYLFNRGEHPVVVLDSAGAFRASWGHGLFTNAHGAYIGPDQCIYLTDNGNHTVRKFDLSGRLLLSLGEPNKPAPFMSGRPFCRCTHTALSPHGDIYVSDGYDNAAVHKYDPAGRLLLSWGKPGTGPGEFNLPHNICCDPDGWVYVADRENHRVQVFDRNGRYETQINNMHRPSGLAITPGKCPCCVVGELISYQTVNRLTPNLGARVSIIDQQSNVITRIDRGIGPGIEPGQFISPHSIALDSKGDIYVGEVVDADWLAVFPDRPKPPKTRRVQKFGAHATLDDRLSKSL